MMRAWRGSGWVGLALAMSLGATGANAAEGKEEAAPARLVCPICAHAADPHYGSKAGHTLARGATNALLGWTEMIRQPAQEAKEGHSVLTGLNKGVNRSVGRTLSGFGELLTFWAPKDSKGRYVHFAQDCPLCMGREK